MREKKKPTEEIKRKKKKRKPKPNLPGFEVDFWTPWTRLIDCLFLKDEAGVSALVFFFIDSNWIGKLPPPHKQLVGHNAHPSWFRCDCEGIKSSGNLVMCVTVYLGVPRLEVNGT